jgi:hypothetical protein
MISCVIVHETSFPYVRNVLKALIEALQDSIDPNCRMIISSSVDSALIEDARVVFVIGENLGRFKRLKGRYYIYLNFSVITMLGSPFKCGFRGVRLIHYKKALLQSKLDLFDALLDYYPPQTRYLAKRLAIPVAGFVPWVLPPIETDLQIAIPERPFDVCFVGGLSPRRKRIIDMLRSEGCILSPSSGVIAEDIAAQSKCTINIHMQRSNHLEIPRVMGAVANSVIVTETSYGIDELFPKNLLQQVPYGKLVEQTLATLANENQLIQTTEISRQWYCDVGAPRSKINFISAVKELLLNMRLH